MELIELTDEKAINEGGVGYREIIEIVLGNWYWFLLSVAVCMGIAYFYLAGISPVYKQSAVLLVKNDNRSGGSRSALLEINSEFSTSGIENDLYILRSRQLMRKVAEQLRLDIDYAVRNRFRNDPLYAESPVRVSFPIGAVAPFSMDIVPLNEKKFQLLFPETISERWGGEKAFGDTIVTPFGNFVVRPVPENLPAYINKPILVSVTSIESAANSCQSRIATSLADAKTTLVKIDCTDANISRAKAILKTLIEIYNETIIDDKNRIAANTAQFIDERIVIIGKELGEVEEELTDFRQRNRIVNIASSASQYLSESSKAKEENQALETQLSVARYVKTYLSDITHKDKLIPNVSGIGDVGIQSQIQAYNGLLLQRDRVLSNSGENNPVVQDMNKNLVSMRETISGSMDNYINTLSLRLNKARSAEIQAMSNIQSVPKQEKMDLSIVRQQTIKESLYTFLLNKREENALQLAITVANIRVVETPFGSAAPIAPARSQFFLFAFIIGLLIPGGILVLYFLWNTTIHGRKDIETRTTIPILGEIPAYKSKSKADNRESIVVSEDNNDRMTEAFRLLQVNMKFMANHAKVLMFTSAMAGDGKTFLCGNFAVSLAYAGKKVIILDLDLRKKTQSRQAGKEKTEGISAFLSEQQPDVKSLIQSGVIGSKVDLIPAGSTPPNISVLLMNERLDRLIAFLKQRYDYILLDVVPALIVSDAVIVSRVAELTLYVVRDGVFDRRYLPELEKLYREKKFKNMCIVLNDCRMEKHKYGYRYGYGYHYGYHSYSYGEGKEKRKGILARFW